MGFVEEKGKEGVDDDDGDDGDVQGDSTARIVTGGTWLRSVASVGGRLLG